MYRDFYVRLASFTGSNWPANHTLHPYVLAKCGFFISSNQKDALITSNGRENLSDYPRYHWFKPISMRFERMVSHARGLFKTRQADNDRTTIKRVRSEPSLNSEGRRHHRFMRIQCYFCQYGRYRDISLSLKPIGLEFLKQHQYVSPECRYATIKF